MSSTFDLRNTCLLILCLSTQLLLEYTCSLIKVLLVILIVCKILSCCSHSTLNFVHQMVLNLPCGRLLKIFKILCLNLIRHLLLSEVLLTELANVQFFQLPPALDAQAAHILGSFDMHLDDWVKTLEEASVALLNFVAKSLPNQG